MAKSKVKLGSNSYGKSGVRMVKVSRHPRSGRHDMTEIEVAIALEGDFDAIHCRGDNALCLPTDTMKNTVYALGKDHPLDSIESFALHLGRHFVRENPQVAAATICISEKVWKRVRAGRGKGGHPHCFLAGAEERPACEARVERTRPRSRSLRESVRSGIDGLVIVKTTNSAFDRFQRDRFTTLRETRDRIFGTSVSAWWDYPLPARSRPDFGGNRRAIREAMISTFAAHMSESVQQTLYEMGRAALAACPAARRIRLSMPNQHRILVDLAPLGLTNNNEIFVPTSEPYGLIEATIERA